MGTGLHHRTTDSTAFTDTHPRHPRNPRFSGEAFRQLPSRDFGDSGDADLSTEYTETAESSVPSVCSVDRWARSPQEIGDSVRTLSRWFPEIPEIPVSSARVWRYRLAVGRAAAWA